MYGTIEIGGTKVICALMDDDAEILESERFPTSTPGSFFDDVHSFFNGGDVDCLGIAAFGPIVVDPGDPRYGTVLRTPKPYWSGTDIISPLKDICQMVKVDTDVNCACLGEFCFDGFGGDSSLVYITIGTGIGAGVVVDGKPLHGRIHPEAGHISLKRLPGDSFIGGCPFHDDCATSLASGKALEMRAGARGEMIPEDDPLWGIEAGYIAQVAYSCALAYSPDHIVLGGGIMDVPGMMDMVRRDFVRTDGGYLFDPSFRTEDYIRPSGLKGDQALLGAFALHDL